MEAHGIFQGPGCRCPWLALTFVHRSVVTEPGRLDVGNNKLVYSPPQIMNDEASTPLPRGQFYINKDLFFHLYSSPTALKKNILKRKHEPPTPSPRPLSLSQRFSCASPMKTCKRGTHTAQLLSGVKQSSWRGRPREDSQVGEQSTEQVWFKGKAGIFHPPAINEQQCKDTYHN